MMQKETVSSLGELKFKEHERRIVELEKKLEKHMESFDAHQEQIHTVKTNKELQKELKDSDN